MANHPLLLNWPR